MSKLALYGGKAAGCGPFTEWPVICKDEINSVMEVFDKKYSDGYYTELFEKNFSRYCGVRHCIAVSNGTVSLELILRALNIGKGDEVILPPYTFIATLSSVIFAGATPVFADIERGSYNISPVSAENKITPKTKAIIAVSVAGRPVNIDELELICKKHKIHLINDAAQAVGAQWKGKSIASYGIASSFSCQNSKNLTGGEGGIITTNNDDLYKNINSILNHGIKDGKIVFPVRNYKMNEYSAAILLNQLNKLKFEIQKRSVKANYLTQYFKTTEYIYPHDYDERITVNAYHLYIMRFNKNYLAEHNIKRETLIAAVNAEGLPLSGGYTPLYTAPCLNTDIVKRICGDIDRKPLSECERASYEEGAWLYQSCLLGNEESIKSICCIFDKIYQNISELSGK